MLSSSGLPLTLQSSESWYEGQPYTVILFYRYVNIENIEALRSELLELCKASGILGRILIAPEGINGTLAGSISSIEEFMVFMKTDLRFSQVDWKTSDILGTPNNCLPFLTLSIRETKEIISCGRAREFLANNSEFEEHSFGGLSGTGTHLTPTEFHTALENIPRDGGTLLDIRNQFEYDIGHFDKAVGLNCATYAESWPILDNVLKESKPDNPIYMYCTGGIRCEKASVYLKAKGFENVFQLQGGIHRYLEEYTDGGHFKGRNFVFDSRVSVPAAGGVMGIETATGDSNSSNNSCSNMNNNENCSIDSNFGSNGYDNITNSSVTAPTIPSTNNDSAIIGRCVDCSQPFDVFSGLVVCTVCRLPVLVCGVCAVDKCYPGEFHCFRHRHLKHMYFTVLERFTESELLQQIADLSNLEKELLVDTKAKSRRRTLRNQKDRIAIRIKEIKNILHEKDEKDEKGVIEVEEEDANKINEIEQGNAIEEIKEITVAEEMRDSNITPNIVEPNVSESNDSTPTSPSATTTSTSTTPPTSTSNTLSTSKITKNPFIPNLISAPSEQSIPSNPKTRLGWGFWKT